MLSHPKPYRPLLAPIAVVALLVACAAPGANPSAEPGALQSDEPSAETAPAEPDGPPVSGEVPQELMDRILDDAARRTGLEPAEIEVVQATAVTWNDGSLGCPQPGQMYPQALVDGYHVILRAGQQELDYRASSRGDFKLCEGGGSEGNPSS